MWPFPRKKPFFSPEENERIVASIRNAEMQTSGEIRVFVESRCKYIDALDRASEVFLQLKMDKTELRNGVLFYLAVKDHQLAVYADKGIHEVTGNEHWKNVVNQILALFKSDNIAEGIITCVSNIGDALKTHFPYNKEVDKNELPDEIVFGT